ncbi:MAG: hypothetical protein HQL90_04360 [Magnetococcales bacterium]|nr:hypothetical protein [Magnetococcales bacterium]
MDVTTINDRAISINELESIANANGGVLTPDAVVDAARSESSTLHRYFNWDDTEAAHMYRLAQARGFIRKITVHVVRSDSQSREVVISPVRAYHALPESGDTGKKTYQHVQAIMTDAEKRERLVGQVLRDLNALRKKYASISELSAIWAAIDAMVD